MQISSPWIAIVDDDAAVRKALTRLLSGRAFRTQGYHSAREFLEALPGGRPQCLIVDLQMPQLSGSELLVHLSRRGIQIPTIILTAHGDLETRRRCKNYPSTVAFLTKPVQEAELFAAIEMASGIANHCNHKQL